MATVIDTASPEIGHGPVMGLVFDFVDQRPK
jgi:hypothetical protein